MVPVVFGFTNNEADYRSLATILELRDEADAHYLKRTPKQDATKIAIVMEIPEPA